MPRSTPAERFLAKAQRTPNGEEKSFLSQRRGGAEGWEGRVFPCRIFSSSPREPPNIFLGGTRSVASDREDCFSQRRKERKGGEEKSLSQRRSDFGGVGFPPAEFFRAFSAFRGCRCRAAPSVKSAVSSLRLRGSARCPLLLFACFARWREPFLILGGPRVAGALGG